MVVVEKKIPYHNIPIVILIEILISIIIIPMAIIIFPAMGYKTEPEPEMVIEIIDDETLSPGSQQFIGSGTACKNIQGIPE